MFGLDDHIASLSDGTTIAVVVLVAVALGLRHAGDPDHLAAMTTLVASGRDRAAARLGLAWGLGHATSLLALGVPVVLYRAYLPGSAQRLLETAVGVMIVLLALRLLFRPRRATRGTGQAYAVGVVHGAAGTGGVGVLLLASIPDHALALVCLVVFAGCAALSMTTLSAWLGPLVARPLARVAPLTGTASLAFGVWYALGPTL
jgi:hypothetical protein